jgi:carbonic anhydrase
MKYLVTPLFVVLGHEGCGAVTAALRAKSGSAIEGGRLADLHLHPNERSV